ncbi:MAG: type II secretion system protein [Patescibacteria group bacterium]|nr:type II secretion system GspH family protein [Patescibacteria group bacterium]
MQFNKKGFTLIELLIVIVILGILATAILSAINPIEQIRKANDAGKKSDAAELLNAYERYYTTFQAYPWAAAAPNHVLANAAGAFISELVLKNEVKPEFARRTNLGLLYVTQDATSLVHTCFVPESATSKAVATFTSACDGTLGTKGVAGNCICLPE